MKNAVLGCSGADQRWTLDVSCWSQRSCCSFNYKIRKNSWLTMQIKFEQSVCQCLKVPPPVVYQRSFWMPPRSVSSFQSITGPLHLRTFSARDLKWNLTASCKCCALTFLNSCHGYSILRTFMRTRSWWLWKRQLGRRESQMRIYILPPYRHQPDCDICTVCYYQLKNRSMTFTRN